MPDWVATIGKALVMVILPIIAFAMGVGSVDWHDDSLRKAVIAKTWSPATSTIPTTDGNPATADAKNSKEAADKQVEPNKKPEPKKK